jgi:hypothetical protein
MLGQTIDLNALYQVCWADKSVEFIWSVLKAQEVNAHCQGFMAMARINVQGDKATRRKVNAKNCMAMVHNSDPGTVVQCGLR